MAKQAFVQFGIDIYQRPNIGTAIAQLRRRLTTVKPVLEEIGKIYVESTKLRFESQTDPKGRVWKHNTKQTQDKKRKGFWARGSSIEGANKRLVWTGKLRKSIHYRVGGNTVYVMSDMPYAPLQQFGATAGMYGGFWNAMYMESGWNERGAFQPIPWAEVPPRRFLGPNLKTNEKVLGVLGDYLLGNKVARKLGFNE